MEAAKIVSLVPDIAKKIKEYMEANEVTITEVAKEVNYSRTALSRYLNGKYEGDTTRLQELLAAYLQKHSGQKICLSAQQFFESRDAADIIGVCKACQEFTGLGIVVGKTGYGKSHTLKHYAKMPRVAYVECDDIMGTRDLVETIEKALGIPPVSWSTWKRVNGIKKFFNVNKGYLLIIDEADKLISKYTHKKMEILRSIFDQSDVGLVIAGEHKLESQIKGHLARFANRVDFYCSLKGLTQKEVTEYLQGWPFTDDALREMVKRATGSPGCFRLMNRTLKNVMRLMGSPEAPEMITLDLIARASEMMML